LRTVKEILMERDGMLPEDADALIYEFEDMLDSLLESGAEGMPGTVLAEELLEDYFGLEPDYLMEFLT
jgi:hypothetical protein